MAKPTKPVAAVKKVTAKKVVKKALAKPDARELGVQSEFARRREMFKGLSDEGKAEFIMQICEILATSERSLVSILKDNPNFPNLVQFHEWIDASKSLSNIYTRAKQLRADYMADVVMDISDNGANDFTTGRDGQMVLDAEHVQRSKLRVDTRKWLMSKFNRAYSDSTTLRGDPDNPLIPAEKPDLSKLTNEELKMFIALQSKVEKKK
jgi:hypothetical protein